MPERLIGTTLGGCLILEIIGRGGMGVIYKARQKSLDRIVAMKVLSGELSADPVFVQRFLHEARAVAKINHPNILQVYDVGRATGDTGTEVHYMVMELIEGCSLAEMQEKRGVIPPREAVDYIIQAARGLEAAQAESIIHRDVKPDNLMITTKEVIKVSDFGLAKEADAQTTSSDAVMGTPAFMSPEQCDGKVIDGRTDIYSLGGTFYKLLTGRLPFEAETAMSMMYRHKHETLTPPHEVNPEVPLPLSRVVVKMMAKQREERYQNLREVITALESALAAISEEAPPKKEGEGEEGEEVLGEAGAVRRSTSLLPRGPRPLSGRSRAVPKLDRTTVVRPREAASQRRKTSLTSISGRLRPPGARGTVAGPPLPPKAPPPPPEPVPEGEIPAAASGRLPAQSGLLPAVPEAAPPYFPGGEDDPHTHLARAEEFRTRGDRIGALKCYRKAVELGLPDRDLAAEIEQVFQAELQTRTEAATSFLERGLLIEAGRELRLLLELDPENDAAREQLGEIDQQLAQKRKLQNEIRNAIAHSKYEEAVALFQQIPEGMREPGLTKQIEAIRMVTLPTIRHWEKGFELLDRGEIEGAQKEFEAALEIDPNAERARQGLQEVQRKLKRVQEFIRYGDRKLIERDLAAAVDYWTQVLTVEPSNRTTIKRITDALHDAAEQELKTGALAQAIRHWEMLLQYNPEFTEAQRKLEEARFRQVQETACIENATRAQNAGRYSKAIHHWNLALRINPGNKQALQALESARKSRRRRWAKLSGGIAVVATLCSSAGWYLWEWKRVADGRRHLREGDPAACRRVLQGPFLLLGEAHRQLLGQADILDLLSQAEKRLQEQQYLSAADDFQRAAERAKTYWPEREEELGKKVYLCQALELYAGALDLRRQKSPDWSALHRSLAEAVRKFERGAPLPEKYENAFAEAQRLKESLALLAQAEEAFLGADYPRAEKLYQEAAGKTRPEDLESKLIGERLANCRANLTRFEREFAAGMQALHRARAARATVTTAPDPQIVGALENAVAHLQRAAAEKPDDRAARDMLLYAGDMLTCEKAGMALVSPLEPDPIAQKTWGGREREEAFCIGRFELFTEVDGRRMPQTMAYFEVKGRCQQQVAGSGPCTVVQWTDACKAEGRTLAFPYGEKYLRDLCNVGTRKIAPVGSYSRCRNALGLWDMSGNVAEWVYDPTDRTHVYLAGGSAFTPEAEAIKAGCNKSHFVPVRGTGQVVEEDGVRLSGARCCKKLVPGE